MRFSRSHPRPIEFSFLVVAASCLLALVENNQAEVVRQCRLLVETRGRQLQRCIDMTQRGFGSKLKLSIAMRRLVGSRYQLSHVQGKPADALQQLERVVQLCNDELIHLTKLQKSGAASAMELNRARHRTTVAEHHLARTKNDSQSVLPKLRQSVVLCQQEMDQIKHLRQRGYADMIDEYDAHSHFLNAKLLLANLEKEPGSLRKQFDDLIRLYEETLPQLKSDRDGRLARLLIERELARDRGRKAQFLRDGYLADDLSVAEIDF